MKHIGSPDDIKGVHYDLLVEDKEFCKTWRLSDIPLLDGPYVDSVYTAPHNLSWLDIKEKVVSGNRGVAKRIKQGIFLQSFASLERNSINLSLVWDKLEVDLLLDENGCRLLSKKK